MVNKDDANEHEKEMSGSSFIEDQYFNKYEENVSTGELQAKHSDEDTPGIDGSKDKKTPSKKTNGNSDSEDGSYFDRHYFENVMGLQQGSDVSFLKVKDEAYVPEIGEKEELFTDKEAIIEKPKKSGTVALMGIDPRPRAEGSNIPEGELSAEQYAVQFRKEKNINLHMNPGCNFYRAYHYSDKPFWCEKPKPVMDDDEIEIDQDLDEDEFGEFDRTGTYVPPVTTPPYNRMTIGELCNFLRQSIVHDCEDFLAINKPYGLACQGGDNNDKFHVDNLLRPFADLLKEKELKQIHRLDRNTTGILLLGKNSEATDAVKDLFRNRQISKTYTAITVGVPYPRSGVIKDPIQPFYNYITKTNKMFLAHEPNEASHNAATAYNVVSARGKAALVDIHPKTGYRHQIRTHLAQSLGTPILGDHKYSTPAGDKPQIIPPSILESMNMRQSKTRYIMQHLHARKMMFHYDVNDNPRFIEISARYHRYFMNTLRLIRLRFPPRS